MTTEREMPAGPEMPDGPELAPDPGQTDGPDPIVMQRRLAGLRLVAVYIVVMLAAVGAAAGLTIWFAPHPPASPCPALPAPCSVPPGPLPPLPKSRLPLAPALGQPAAAGEDDCPAISSIGRELVLGHVLPLARLGVVFVYNDCEVALDEADGSHAIFEIPWPDHPHSFLRVDGAPADQETPIEQIQRIRESDGNLTGQLDPAPYRVIKGPEVGYEVGGAIGVNYSGQVDDSTGLPVGNGEWTYVSATNGTVTLTVSLFDQEPDDVIPGFVPPTTYDEATRSVADELLEDVRWSPAQ